MADIYGTHFEYAGKSSRDVGIMIATLDTDRYKNVFGTVEGAYVFNKSGNRRYYVSDDRSGSPVSFDIEIMDDNLKAIPYTERRRVEQWLFNTPGFSKLYFDMSDDPEQEMYEYIDGQLKRNYLNCRFVNPVKIENEDGVVGYKATLEADSDMFWQDSTVKTLVPDMSGGYDIITLNIDSDGNEYMYPTVYIKTGTAGGDITIANLTDDEDRKLSFAKAPANASIVTKGVTNYVNPPYSKIIRDRNFVRLVSGDNNIYVKGDIAEIKVEYQNRRVF